MSVWLESPSVPVLPRHPSIKIRPLWLHSFPHCCLVCSLASVKPVEWQRELTGGPGLICSRYCLFLPWLPTSQCVLYLHTLNHRPHTHKYKHKTLTSSPHWCINRVVWSPDMTKVWVFHQPTDPEPELLIMFQSTRLNLNSSPADPSLDILPLFPLRSFPHSFIVWAPPVPSLPPLFLGRPAKSGSGSVCALLDAKRRTVFANSVELRLSN